MTFVDLKATAYFVKKICVLTLLAIMESYTNEKKLENSQIDKINVIFNDIKVMCHLKLFLRM